MRSIIDRRAPDQAAGWTVNPAGRFIAVLAFLAAFWGVNPYPACAQSPATSGEAQVKAAMIFNIVGYVDWPAETFPSAASPLTVCVLGSGPLASATTALAGQQQKGRFLTVKKIPAAADAAPCQVLVITDAEEAHLSAILEKVRQTPLVTISDMNAFAEAGGVVELAKEGSRIRLLINLAAAQQHRVRISSQLLKLARIVRESK